MKSLVQKIGLFFLILLAIKLAFVFLRGDSFVYREPAFSEAEMRGMIDRHVDPQVRFRYAEIAEESFDTVFIGTSRTNYNIAPTYFDRLTSNRTKSYNFGINGGLTPQSFDWCEELIRARPSLKYIFFELSARDVKDSLAQFSWDGLTFPAYAAKLENHLNLSAVSALKPRIFPTDNQPDYRKPRMIFREFNDDYNVPLEEFLKKTDKPAAKLVSLREIELSHRRNLAAEQSETDLNYPLDENYRNRVARLIELAESKGIRIYFYLPARLGPAEPPAVLPIYKKLDPKYRLGVRHFDDSLYRPDASFDEFHLNHAGARRFTELLAAAFNDQNF